MSALNRMVGAAGAADRPGPVDEDRWTDGHARWELYCRAAGQPEAAELLLAAVRAETDLPLSSSVVVMMLEKVPAEGRRRWVDALRPENRGFAERRSDELAVLDSLDREDRSFDAGDVEAWSDWLQLRAAQGETGGDGHVLDLLAEHGRTKRIRRHAAESAAGRRARER
ncbi:hypothetical protein ABZS61_12970 [Streptomyces sp. NPDC005566]|uniref:hypothetical protein n=1 Tax=Streptomyces sp. NPDC005566 TaxID=3156886 RepID=UPI0033A2A82C